MLSQFADRKFDFAREIKSIWISPISERQAGAFIAVNLKVN